MSAHTIIGFNMSLLACNLFCPDDSGKIQKGKKYDTQIIMHGWVWKVKGWHCLSIKRYYHFYGINYSSVRGGRCHFSHGEKKPDDILKENPFYDFVQLQCKWVIRFECSWHISLFYWQCAPFEAIRGQITFNFEAVYQFAILSRDVVTFTFVRRTRALSALMLR